MAPEAPLWVYRLPSIIGATLSVLAAFWLARAFMGPAGALLVGGFRCSGNHCRGGGAARQDGRHADGNHHHVAQGALARIWLKKPGIDACGALSFVFWTALAASVLIKGPVGPMVVGTTLLGLFIADAEAFMVQGRIAFARLSYGSLFW